MSVFVIAEAGVNHNGEIRLAKELIKMAVRCGADAIKFQTFKAEDCVNKQADKVGYQKENDKRIESQYEMLKRLELTYEEFRELKRECEKEGIIFLSTPFGKEALDFLVELGVTMIKLSSTEVTNHPYLRKVAQSGKPIILSTGMSYLQEVEEAIQVIKTEGNNRLYLLHCTTDYPTKAGDVNIRSMQTMREKLGVEVGYSDHTEGMEAAIAAVALGAKIIEKHITLDREMQGPDHKASMEEEAFRQYIQGIRNTEMLLGDGVKQPTYIEEEMRMTVRRSIVAKKLLESGTVLTEDLLEYKRPATGLSPIYAEKIIGKVVKRKVGKDEIIQLEDVEDR
ncbi:MAG: N-acetylneuraminate synthase [Cellulosilyticaceae bacterium]